MAVFTPPPAAEYLPAAHEMKQVAKVGTGFVNGAQLDYYEDVGTKRVFSAHTGTPLELFQASAGLFSSMQRFWEIYIFPNIKDVAYCNAARAWFFANIVPTHSKSVAPGSALAGALVVGVAAPTLEDIVRKIVRETLATAPYVQPSSLPVGVDTKDAYGSTASVPVGIPPGEVPLAARPAYDNFTGTTKDAAGREYYWKNGARIGQPDAPLSGGYISEVPADARPADAKFTGVTKDAAGREYTWKDGARVA
jgi:hypothetical protein